MMGTDYAILLIVSISLIADLGFGAPGKNKCILGDGLFNSLVGKGSRDTGVNEAEEDALGWPAESPEAVAKMAFTEGHLTYQQFKDCMEEYEKMSASTTIRPLPPGVVSQNDPSRQQYLPFTNGKDETVGLHGEYYTTYDGSHYRFKEKGYVIEQPDEPTSSTPAPLTTSLPTSPHKTTRKPSNKNKDELKLWYNAFVSVVSKYV